MLLSVRAIRETIHVYSPIILRTALHHKNLPGSADMFGLKRAAPRRTGITTFSGVLRAKRKDIKKTSFSF